MARIQKTILCLEVNDNEWNLKYNGSLDFPQLKDKVSIKHDTRLMRALISDERLFKLFYRIVEPARRYYRREAKKKALQQQSKD